eukprot:TRINITY_DN67918_c10_g9_i1.p1 TRINITY_DN67918_c10_g9~~TRINITY_DN67918_c10_g9_i1.p1  ORF type:complete len:198 (-),score=11.74 TRINITY_DN67918_c10_g9_i1:388-981(-)
MERLSTSKPGVVYMPFVPVGISNGIQIQDTLEKNAGVRILNVKLNKQLNANSRKTDTRIFQDGWIEFANKKSAKRIAKALNATPLGSVGSNKKHRAASELWGLRYVKGVTWADVLEEDIANQHHRRQRLFEERKEARKLGERCKHLAMKFEDRKKQRTSSQKRPPAKREREPSDASGPTDKPTKKRKIVVVKKKKPK